MYEIVFMGIPCRECDVTEEFLQNIEEIKSGNCFAVTLADYSNIENNNEVINSIYGHNILFDNIEFIKYYGGQYIKNKINTMGTLWHITVRNPEMICSILLNEFDNFYLKTKFDKVIILTPGSPTIDILPKSMAKIRPVKIVDIKSPIVIAAEHMSPNYIIRKFTKDFLLNGDPQIYLNVVNVFFALSGSYNNTGNKEKLILFYEHMQNHLDPTDTIFYVYVGETVIVNKILFSNFLEKIDYFSNNIENLTLGVYKNLP
jgi:hypothetical protein